MSALKLSVFTLAMSMTAIPIAGATESGPLRNTPSKIREATAVDRPYERASSPTQIGVVEMTNLASAPASTPQTTLRGRETASSCVSTKSVICIKDGKRIPGGFKMGN
ncbi:hypothetical protein ASG62_24555 [Aureimonas sp. Leaf427]|nr:hypothetical protein ASG62_24555 [Aureimonas sp. Leaf427]